MPRIDEKANSRSAPTVFKVGDSGVAHGLPAERRGAWFICDPPCDRRLANEYLAALHTGDFARLSSSTPPPWMAARSKLRPANSSQRRTAQALSLGLRHIEAMGASVLTLDEQLLDKLGERLEANNLSGGHIGAIQCALIACAQYGAWKNARPPLSLVFTRSQVRGETFRKDAIRIAVVRKQAPSRPGYIEPEAAMAIADNMPDPASRLGWLMVYLAGLRGSEPGNIEAAAVPRPGAASDWMKVLGKGNKERKVQVALRVVEEGEIYRVTHRPKRAKTFMRLTGNELPPPHFLLNGKNGSPLTYNALRRAFRKAAEAAGYGERGLKLQWGRHSYGSNFMVDHTMDYIEALEASGVQVNEGQLDAFREGMRSELQLGMGHSSFETTSIYTQTARLASVHRLKQIRHRRLGATE